MQSITATYLLDMIEKKMNTAIHLHRRQNPHSLNMALYAKPTAAEIKEFIHSIPYFDNSLKDFLIITSERQTIISQKWETEFIKKVDLWLGSYEWMYGKPCSQNYKEEKTSLGLPY